MLTNLLELLSNRKDPPQKPCGNIETPTKKNVNKYQSHRRNRENENSDAFMGFVNR